MRIQVVIYAAIAFLLITIVLFWRLFTPVADDRFVLAKGDFTLHYYSFTPYQAERITNGEIPLWNPYNYSGEPFAANIQRATFYPPRLLLIALFGSDWSLQSYMFEVALHYWLAAILMFIYIYIIMQRWEGALIGATVFAFGGYAVAYPMLQPSILAAGVWLPLVLTGLYMAMAYDSRKMLYGVSLAAIGLCLSILAGHPQTTIYVAYLSFAYWVWLGWQKKTRWLMRFIIGVGIVVGAVGLSAIQLLPALEFIQYTSRAEELSYSFNANGFHYNELIGFFIPTLGSWSPLYVGIVGLFFAGIVVYVEQQQARFWLLVSIVSLLLGLGGHYSFYDLFYVFNPFTHLFRQQERIALLIIFSIAMLASLGVHHYWERNNLKRSALRWAVVIFGGTSIAYLMAFLLENETYTLRLGFVLLNLTLLWLWLWWPKTSMSMASYGLLAILAFDLLTVGIQSGNFQPDQPENRVQLPALLEQIDTTERFSWRIDGAAGLRGYGTLFNLQDIYGAGPLVLDTMISLYELPVDKFWEVLSVRYVTTTDILPSETDATLLGEAINEVGETYRLYELSNPRPIVHLVYDYRVADNRIFARQIMADNRVNLRELAVTAQPLPFELGGIRPSQGVDISYEFTTPEKLLINVSTPENALLTVSIPYYVGWQAMVNGKKVDIVETNAGLMGIPLRAGAEQQIVLTYRPQSYIWGRRLSLGTMSILFLMNIMSFSLQWYNSRQTTEEMA